VRILQFYASTGMVTPGQTARICYSVENAKSVRILSHARGSLLRSQSLPGNCAGTYHPLHPAGEGYDGAVATKSITLQVEVEEAPPPQVVNYAAL